MKAPAPSRQLSLRSPQVLETRWAAPGLRQMRGFRWPRLSPGSSGRRVARPRPVVVEARVGPLDLRLGERDLFGGNVVGLLGEHCPRDEHVGELEDEVGLLLVVDRAAEGERRLSEVVAGRAGDIEARRRAVGDLDHAHGPERALARS